MSPENFPVNALAAESRRNARFFALGHTPGTVDVPPEEPNPEHPFTLDLRRPEPVQYRAPTATEQSVPVGRVSAGLIE
jgi:hypothetical protein